MEDRNDREEYCYRNEDNELPPGLIKRAEKRLKGAAIDVGKIAGAVAAGMVAGEALEGSPEMVEKFGFWTVALLGSFGLAVGDIRNKYGEDLTTLGKLVHVGARTGVRMAGVVLAVMGASEIAPEARELIQAGVATARNVVSTAMEVATAGSVVGISMLAIRGLTGRGRKTEVNEEPVEEKLDPQRYVLE